MTPKAGSQVLRLIQAIIDWFVPRSCWRDPDRFRRARLIAHFGLQGTVFGTAYAIFYYVIGHVNGANVIVACSAIFAAVPWILKHTGRMRVSGQIVVGTMAFGFTQLALIEGGIHSHAVAWLASVPLCALLILGVWPAIIWAIVCFLVGVAIGITAMYGLELTPMYDLRWHNLVDAAGNVGIVIFLFALGLVFEVNRASAFQHMRVSLDQLAATNEELAHLNNEKTEFLGIAAHDLRNPLTIIIGFASFLHMDANKEVADIGHKISRAGKRMLELLSDLLDANMIEEGRYAASLEAHDLRDLVNSSVENNGLTAGRKNIVLDFPDGDSCWVQVDEKAAMQVLDNLISNAVKYSPLGSRVSISMRAEGEWADFIIQDEGPGISEADQQKLFKKHTKLTARPTGGESSIGLGLCIVKRLAEAMGGAVRCESSLGNGAKFIVRFRAASMAQLAA